MTVFGDFACDAEFQALKALSERGAQCLAKLDQLTANNPRCTPWVPSQAEIDSERPLLEAAGSLARFTGRPPFDFAEALAILSPTRLV